LEIFAFVICVF